MNLLVSGSIPLEGSSKIIRFGFESKAIANWSFRLFPPDKFSAQVVEKFSKERNKMTLSAENLSTPLIFQ